MSGGILFCGVPCSASCLPWVPEKDPVAVSVGWDICDVPCSTLVSTLGTGEGDGGGQCDRASVSVGWDILWFPVPASCLPWVPEKGTVGASGDLAPLAHLAMGMIGEGKMWSPKSGWAEAKYVSPALMGRLGHTPLSPTCSVSPLRPRM